jgi:hypothetical protein
MEKGHLSWKSGAGILPAIFLAPFFAANPGFSRRFVRFFAAIKSSHST